MDEITKLIKRAAELVRELPDDLRPVAFRYLLEHLSVTRTTNRTKHKNRKKHSLTPINNKTGKLRKKKLVPDTISNIDVPKLKEFVEEKAPRNHEERYAVIAAHFSQDGVSRISEEHIRTCYKVLRWQKPGNFEQIFCNAHSRKLWFSKRGDDGRRELTDVGMTYVMDDLPKQPSTSMPQGIINPRLPKV